MGKRQEITATTRYDPASFIPLFANILVISGSRFDLTKFIESNWLGLVVMSLSSNDIAMRKAGYFVMDHTLGLLEASNLRQKRQILLILNSLKIAITDWDTPQMIPSIIALFVAQGLSIFMKPEHFMYPLINQFLLKRPG
jgi:hypothetical protein